MVDGIELLEMSALVSLKILWMIFNCCSVKPLLENFTFVSPPSTGLQVVIKWSDALFSIFDEAIPFENLALAPSQAIVYRSSKSN